MSTQTLLIHPTRRKIWKLITENSGASFLKICSALQISQATLTWHLKMLQKAQLVESFKYLNRRIYYPSVLSNEEAEKLFLVLENDTARKIFSYVLNNPGCYPQQIARAIKPPVHHETVRNHISRLQRENLITIRRETKLVRCYSGEAAQRLQEGGLRIISDQYVSFLITELRKNCMYPEIIERSNEHLVIRVECPNGEDLLLALKLEEWDFATILSTSKDSEEIELTDGEMESIS